MEITCKAEQLKQSLRAIKHRVLHACCDLSTVVDTLNDLVEKIECSGAHCKR